MTSLLCLLALLVSPQDDVDPLLERLKTEDGGARRKVQEELIRRGASAVPAVVRALENAAPGAHARVAALVKQLASASWKERNEATRELVRLGRGARTILEEHGGSSDPEVAWRVRAALAEIQEQAGRDEQLDDLRASALCEILGEMGDRRGAGPLLKILAAGAPEQRIELKVRAADALGRLRPALEPAQADEAAERIMTILEKTPSPLAKGVLLKALGRLKAPSALRPLAALLADRSEKNVHIKRSCMAALAALGDPRGVRAVIDALGADDPYVRQGAAAVLEELSGRPTAFDPRATPEENRAAIEKFKAWGAAKFGKDWVD